MNEELVAPLVEEVRAAVVSELGPLAARFDFTADVEEGLKLHADHPFLLQALTDLVKNAAEAYPPSSARNAVRLTARTRGRTVEIVISDDGYGWHQETLPHAFVPFSSSKREGTGLGLYLARRQVEDQHGGRLTLESEGRDRGTRVRVILPRRQPDVRPRRRLTLREMDVEAARRERAEAGRA
jgi:signal transduction histidine kinase